MCSLLLTVEAQVQVQSFHIGSVGVNWSQVCFFLLFVIALVFQDHYYYYHCNHHYHRYHHHHNHGHLRRRLQGMADEVDHANKRLCHNTS